MSFLESLHARIKRPDITYSPVKLQPEQFTPAFQYVLSKQKSRDYRFAGSAPNGTEEYLNQGNDNTVFTTGIEGKKYVLKKLKASSREYSIFGKGMSPESVPLHGTQTTLTEEYDAHVDINQVAENMRLMHSLVTLNLGEDVVVPKAIFTQDNQLFAVQPYIHHDIPLSDFEINLQTREMFRFYERIRDKWINMTSSSDFFRMPAEVQSFGRYFPPDNGSGTNAFFRGLGMNPPFVLIDY